MYIRVLRFFALLGLLLPMGSCQSQISDHAPIKIDRKPAVAGSFYPSDAKELQTMIQGFFHEAPDALGKQPLAVIVPHAGYVFSGGVAAAAFKQIDPSTKFKHVFIIGSSHTMYFDGVSVYSRGDYITPLGKVPVDTLANWLHRNYRFITDDPKPHEKEHSLEVQLPFLQQWLKQPFTIVPLIIGGESETTCRKLADALAPFFTADNLFVISTDFSHYPTSEDATVSDRLMADAVLTNSAQKFLQLKQSDEGKGTPNLVTAMCGWTSVLTLLQITENCTDVTYQKILYKNSGDSPLYGDKSKVVGYYAIGAFASETDNNPLEFKLLETDKVELLKIARNTITGYLSDNKLPAINEKALPANLLVPAGAFVTLTEKGALRGCIGSFNPQQPLYQVVQSMAVAAATEDYRFSPVTAKEVPEIEIEISVLTPLKKINSINEIVLGKHGIYIKKGARSGTFLPQVATGTGWNLEEFLGHCAQDKAFIGWNGWKDADIYTYEAIVFHEKEFRELLKK
jgi:AmmeMemoRadiSam system protein B/AmmeMemoRadiSam system protein A